MPRGKMSRKYQSDWVQPVLADLAAFFLENDMPESLEAVIITAEVARREAGRPEKSPGVSAEDSS